MGWMIWQQDLTDRSLDPMADSSGEDLGRGLALLWRRTLEEGVGSDGRPKNVSFWLEEEETKVRLQLTTAHPGAPQQTLGALRRLWKAAKEEDREALASALGRFHLKRRGRAIDFFYRDLAPLVAGASEAEGLARLLAGR